MILHVIDSLRAGGAERVLVDLVNGLSGRGIAVGVCITRSEMQMRPELPAEVPVLVLGRRRTWDLGAIRRLVRYCRDQRVSVLHAHGRGSAQLGALVKCLSGGRVKLVFHDHYGEIDVDQAVPPALGVVARVLDRYVAVDPDLRQWAVSRLGVAPGRALVLGNAVDTARFRAAGELPLRFEHVRQPMLAAVVANFRPQKSHDVLFHALARAPRARARLHLLLVGSGADEPHGVERARLVRELGLEENVTFLGSRADVPEVLRAVDFGLLSSRSESGPLTLLEYMASGVPFVATLTGQIAEAAHQAGLPCFVPPGDVGAYSAALEALVGLSAGERQERADRGRELVRDLFSLEERVDRLVHAYRGLGVAAQGISAELAGHGSEGPRRY